MDRFNDYEETNPATENAELDKKKGKCETDEETKKLIQAYMLLYWLGIAILFVVIFGVVVIFNLRSHF
jgi:hypothetical protein